jgi:atypical dual specificity phosphatase
MTNFGWVRPGLLAGMGCPTVDTWALVKAEGVRAVLSLTESPPSHDPRPHGLDWLHVPIQDFGTPSDDDLLRCTTWVDARLREQKPVVVHCFAGIGRTGTVLAAVLVAQGARADEAITEVRRARPGSLETVGQVGAVHRLARRLGRS